MKILNYDLTSYQALLFDLDGTLINSMPLHNKAWTDTLHKNGAPIEQSFLQETAGMKSARIVEIVNERFNLNLQPSDISRQKRNQYLSTLEQIETVDKVMEVVKNFHGKLPMAIITASSHEVVDQLLPKLGIDHYFEAIICADDTTLGKDTTEPYALACSKLGVEMNRCIFFDDGDVGLKGASLSGMDTVHIDVNQPQVFIK